jgi:DNA-binding transcriptional regulator GbsR (MarR family)
MESPTPKVTGSAAVKQRLVQAGGATSQDLGLGRTIGQVLVYLYLTDGECPLDRIEADLGLSKAAVSIASRQLEHLGLVRRAWKRGDRKSYYRTAENIGAALQEGALALLRRKFDATGVAIDDALGLLRHSAGTMDAAEWAFLESRLTRSRQLHRRFSALLSNPIVRRLTRRK